MLDFLLQTDKALFLFLNGLNVSWLDQVMFWISDKYTWIPLYLILLGLCLRYYGWKQTLLILGFIILLITLSDQITGFMKGYFQRPRPSRDPELEGLVHLVNEYRGGRYGFASSHAANSFALAGFMIFLLSKKVKYLLPVLIVWATINSYSRIYLGVHYPGDIVAGGLVGLVAAWVVIKLHTLAARRIFARQRTA
jgi:undecaprenyl-diphosphatase